MLYGPTLALAFLILHLFSLPTTLEDIDSVNFAMGVRDFDVARHQPHPPGYPVFVTIARGSTALLRAAGATAPEVRGLAVLGVLGGAILLLAALSFFRSIARSDDQALVAVTLLGVSPLLWFTALRPLSDVAGLAVAFVAIAAIASTLAPRDGAWTTRESRLLVVGAFAAGWAIGFRSQMAVLTLPLLALALGTRFARVPPHVRAGAVAALSVAVLCWAVPLVIDSGGPLGYLRALGSQAGEDFAGVEMLWLVRTARAALFAAIDTFVLPWGSPVLGGVVLSLAGAGLLVQLYRLPRGLVVLAVVFGPYALFHLLFQETLTIRYALPVVPAVAFLVAATLAEARRAFTVMTTGVLVVLCLEQAIPAALAFGRTPSPVSAALAEMELLARQGAEPLVVMHRRILTETRRAREWVGGLPGRLLPAPRDYEWLEATAAWRQGAGAETWFVADPRRTDLALIDPQHRRTREYRWPFAAGVYVGGVRPNQLDWHIYREPGWFLEQGWALTPEIAGVTERDGWGPHRRPSVGWVRRRNHEVVLMLGGRHLGAAADPLMAIVVALDGRPVARLEVGAGFFLHTTRLPAAALAGDGQFARLTVIAEPVGGGPAVPVGLEQFNLQDADVVQFGFDDGWYEPEFNPRTARLWRWASDHAALRIHHAGRGVAIRLHGESPLRYFGAPPRVWMTAADRILGEWHLGDDFVLDVTAPADVLAAAGGRLVLHTDRVYVPAEREGTADRRRLGLRVYGVDVRAAEGQSVRRR